MFSKQNLECSLHQSVFVFCFVLACITLDFTTMISAQPTASVENLLGSSANKLDDEAKMGLAATRNKLVSSPGVAELSFQQLIGSKPEESTIIGEIKPNASDLEKMLLRTKIANTIQGMQQMEKLRKQAPAPVMPSGGSIASSTTELSASARVAECYIEVTRVDKVPGKCQRASSGLPICQSDNYMTISNECS